MADAGALTQLYGASTMLGTAGALAEARTAGRVGRYEAKEAKTAGIRKAAEAGRAGKMLESDIRAAQAAGGMGAADPGAIETIGKAKAKTEYDVLSALYEGETAADVAKTEAKIKKKAARTRALTTMLSGGARTFKSYKEGY